jgi:hypothetical protein
MRKNDFNQCLQPRENLQSVADGGIAEVSDSKSVSPFAVNVAFVGSRPEGEERLTKQRAGLVLRGEIPVRMHGI